MRKIPQIIVTILAFTLSLFLSSTTFAEEPFTLEDNFVDSANVVADDAKLNEIIKKVPGNDLWVVIVQNCAGQDADDWTKATFTKSHLGKYDGLLVISTETSEIAWWAGNGSATSGVNAEMIDQASDKQMLELLNENKWEEGITHFTENIITLNQGKSLNTDAQNTNPNELDSTNNPSSSNKGNLIGVGIVLAIIGLIIGLVIFIGNKKAKKEVAKAEISLVALAQQASSELLKTDDLVRSAKAELEFARAEFGLEATRQFAQTLAYAQEALQHTFTMRNTLEDNIPETPLQQQQINNEILRIVQNIQRDLTQQTTEFSKMRNLAARADDKIIELATRQKELGARIPLAQQQLANLALTHPNNILRALNSYPEQIEILLKEVDTNLVTARTLVQENKRNLAVAYLKMIEELLGQIRQMLTRINSAPEKLQFAEKQVIDNANSLTKDIADAACLGSGNRLISEIKNRAELLIEKTKNLQNVDILALNDELEQTEAELDTVLAPLREQAEIQKRLVARANKAYKQAENAIAEADDYINRYRGQVDRRARGLLSRAKQDLQNGLQLPLENRIIAFNMARKKAEDALQNAENDLTSNQSGGFDAVMLAGVIISSILNSGSNDRSHHWSSGSSSSGNSFGGGSMGSGGRKGF